MIHQVRVIFGDTDQMGVVYHGNYLRYFEASRAAFLRAVGHSQRSLDEWGVAVPVVEAHVHYRSPAHYEDLIDIHIGLGKIGAASLYFEYRAVRDGTELASGFTRHAVVDTTTGRPRRIPAPLSQLLDRAREQPADRIIS
jgi:acyl-CoA thioester hydrolase